MNEFAVNDVVILHLTTGQAVVATFLEESEDGVTVGKPVELVGGQRPDGTFGFGMMPFLTLGGMLPAFEQFFLGHHLIITPRECPPQIADGYRQTTTGLQIAKTVPPTPPAGSGLQLVRP